LASTGNAQANTATGHQLLKELMAQGKVTAATHPGVAPVSWTLILLGGGPTMGKSRKPYAREFRERMVELVRAGRSPEELSREFEPTAQSIRNWVAQSEGDARQRPGTTTAEREEVRRLRREVKQLKLEREILAKAAAWFARETERVPSKDSDS
jgi:transposase